MIRASKAALWESWIGAFGSMYPTTATPSRWKLLLRPSAQSWLRTNFSKRSRTSGTILWLVKLGRAHWPDLCLRAIMTYTVWSA